VATDEDHFTLEQLKLISDQYHRILEQAGEIVAMFDQYTDAGGRDLGTHTLMLDRLARAGIQLSFFARTALDPTLHDTATEAIARALDTCPDPEIPAKRAAVHERIAMATLTTTWMAGWHHLVTPADWPDGLAELVVQAVRCAPGVNASGDIDDIDLDNLGPVTS